VASGLERAAHIALAVAALGGALLEAGCRSHNIPQLAAHRPPGLRLAAIVQHETGDIPHHAQCLGGTVGVGVDQAVETGIHRFHGH